MTKEKYIQSTNSTKEVQISNNVTISSKNTCNYKMDRIMEKSERRGTQIKININKVKPFFEQKLLCFCKKPVSRYDTLEYGPILECASYDESSPYYNPRFVCGFHVHELSWLKIRQHVLEGYPIYSGYRELETCPLYNFTYCALFNVVNDFQSCPLTMPNCFCNRPTKMGYERGGDNVNLNEASKIVNLIICSNRNVPGAPKCNYLNPSDVTVFPRSKHRLHQTV